MSTYTLHLGYDWNSPLIGSIWTGQPLNMRFLQYALSTSSGAPAWFRFQPNEPLNVMIWDLSSTSAPMPSTWSLRMALSPLDAGSSTTVTYNPSSYMTYPDFASVQPDGANWYLQFLNNFTPDMEPSSPQGPWGGSNRGHSKTFKPVSFTKSLNCKLSFWLSVTAPNASAPEIFISDPEVIVGSTGR